MTLDQIHALEVRLLTSPAIRARWVNALREIVGRSLPVNHAGHPLVSDVDLLLATKSQRKAALIPIAPQEAWDAEIEADSASGALDGLLDEVRAYAARIARLGRDDQGASARRFVMTIGDYHRDYPDMPPSDQFADVVLYDRQEKRVVITYHSAYANAICLEHTHSPEAAPFTLMEQWFNSLDDECLLSEGMTASKPEYRQ